MVKLMAHVAEWKHGEVDEIVNLLTSSKVVGIIEIGGIPAYHGLIDDFRVYDRALGQAEVLDLAGELSVEQPLVSNADTDEDGFVDLGDFAEMASVWLDQVFWP